MLLWDEREVGEKVLEQQQQKRLQLKTARILVTDKHRTKRRHCIDPTGDPQPLVIAITAVKRSNHREPAPKRRRLSEEAAAGRSNIVPVKLLYRKESEIRTSLQELHASLEEYGDVIVRVEGANGASEEFPCVASLLAACRAQHTLQPTGAEQITSARSSLDAVAPATPGRHDHNVSLFDWNAALDYSKYAGAIHNATRREGGESLSQLSPGEEQAPAQPADAAGDRAETAAALTAGANAEPVVASTDVMPAVCNGQKLLVIAPPNEGRCALPVEKKQRESHWSGKGQQTCSSFVPCAADVEGCEDYAAECAVATPAYACGNQPWYTSDTRALRAEDTFTALAALSSRS